MPTTQNALPPRIGRYDILERLAIGGMAEVYLARERASHGFTRLIVVKRILPHLAQHESMVRMFFQEARIAARINHPNVVQILELGEDGLPFIAMEYVPGSTLRDLQVECQRRDRKIPCAVVIQLMIQACAGAHAAHELKDITGKPANLVHRDLTPHNLMVDADGHVKLLDFGIAKEEDSDHTRTGVLKGKIRYMSPEQARQEPLDRRSDIYSLGICTWELLAGERLFEYGSELETMQAIASGKIKDLRAFRPEVPEALVLTIERALARNADDRWPTAEYFRKAMAGEAQDAGMILSPDATKAFVEAVLGERHTTQRAHVQDHLEKSASFADPGPATNSTSMPTGTGTSSLTQVSTVGMIGAASAVFLAGGAAVIAIALVGGLALMVGSGALAEPDAPVAKPPPVVSGAPVRIGLAPVLDTEKIKSDLEPLRVYLEEQLGRPVQYVVASSYDDAGKQARNGDVDFARLPPYVYIDTHEKSPTTAIVVMTEVDGSTSTQGVLLVKESSPYQTSADLRGHTICYTDAKSSTGYLLPRAWLRGEKLNPDRDLQPRMSGTHSQVLRDLVNGDCDVAGTYSGNWLSADEIGIAPASMRTLALTGRTPHDVFVASEKTDPALVARFHDAMLALDVKRDMGIDRIGENERITKFLEADDGRFDDLRKALDAEASKP